MNIVHLCHLELKIREQCAPDGDTRILKSASADDKLVITCPYQGEAKVVGRMKCVCLRSDLQCVFHETLEFEKVIERFKEPTTFNLSDMFQECPTCIAKSGTPSLCQSCLHNKELIDRLYKAKLVLKDIWPYLERYKEEINK